MICPLPLSGLRYQSATFQQFRLIAFQPGYCLHHVRALSQSFLGRRWVKTPFLPLSLYEFENIIVSAWFFYLGFSAPLHYVPDGSVHPLPSAVCAFSEPISSRPWHWYFFGNYTFRFGVHATRVLFGFSLVISGRACSLVEQQTTDRNGLLSFLLGEFVSERLVRAKALNLTVSVQFYLVGSSIVSHIASWLPKVLSYSLGIIEGPTTF